jgi:hypothetical protein
MKSEEELKFLMVKEELLCEMFLSSVVGWR